jgi:hypothetical protein
MASPKVGDSFPEGVVFSYVPYTEEKGDITACGIPINYDASKGLSCPFSPPLPVYQSVEREATIQAFIPQSLSFPWNEFLVSFVLLYPAINSLPSSVCNC